MKIAFFLFYNKPIRQLAGGNIFYDETKHHRAPRRRRSRYGRRTKEGFYGYEKTPVRSEIVGFPPRSDGSVQSCTAEDLVARISHFAAPVSGTPTRFCAFCASFVSIPCVVVFGCFSRSYQ